MSKRKRPRGMSRAPKPNGYKAKRKRKEKTCPKCGAVMARPMDPDVVKKFANRGRNIPDKPFCVACDGKRHYNIARILGEPIPTELPDNQLETMFDAPLTLEQLSLVNKRVHGGTKSKMALMQERVRLGLPATIPEEERELCHHDYAAEAMEEVDAEIIRHSWVDLGR